MMARHKRNAHVEPKATAPAPPTGPKRFTAARFLSNCSDRSQEYLTTNWRNYEQLNSDEVPTDALPAVVIIACYARTYGVDLVDDYTRLLDRYWEEIDECFHPDKFFASCIVILDETEQVPDDLSYETIGIPAIYEELFPEE